MLPSLSFQYSDEADWFDDEIFSYFPPRQAANLVKKPGLRESRALRTDEMAKPGLSFSVFCRALLT